MASSSSAAPAAPPDGLATPPIAAPPGLAPVGTRSADMEGIEGGGEEDDVVVIGQVGTASAGSTAHSRSFADRRRQKTVQAAK
eukprot:7888286-Alexandrium_andersonii.AAC.1